MVNQSNKKIEKYLFYLVLGAIFFLPLERLGSFDVAGLTIRISQLIVLLALFVHVVTSLYHRRLHLIYFRPLIIYIVFLCAGLLSIMGAIDQIRGIQIIAFWVFMVVVAYMIAIFVNSRERLEKAINIFLISGAIFAVLGLLQFAGDMLGLSPSITGLSERYVKEILGFPRIQSTFIEPLYFANYLLIPLALSSSLIVFYKESRKKAWMILLSLLFIATLVLTASKGGILAMIIMLVGIALFQFRKLFNRRNISFVLSGVFFLLILAGVMGRSFVSSPDFGRQFEKAYSIMTGGSVEERQVSYAAAWDAFRTSPINGIGVGNFGPYFSGYPTSQPDFGWPIVNNQYLEVLSETGLIGLLIFLLFLLSVLFDSVLAYHRSSDRFLRSVILAFSLAFLAILLQYATFSTLYVMHIWVLIGLLMAVCRIALNRKGE